MIYFEETLNLRPATPATLDAFIEFAQGDLVPAYEQRGARLVAAWFTHVQVFSQVTQVLEFDSLSDFGSFRAHILNDPALAAVRSRLDSLAPVRRERLLEPLVDTFVDILHDAIAESRAKPVRSYNLAILEVAPGRMEDMTSALADVAASRQLPIVMSWRQVAGDPNEIIDVWKGSLSQPGYRPKDAGPFDDAWWTNLRSLAPEERLVPVYTLPYSPLA